MVVSSGDPKESKGKECGKVNGSWDLASFEVIALATLELLSGSCLEAESFSFHHKT